MQENVPEGDWKMAGIIGLEDEKVEKICKNIENGFVVPANYNCPGQIVISGEGLAVQEAMEKAKEEGARKVIELKTSGPFHTEKLKVAAEKLRTELDQINVKINTNKKIIKNLDGKAYMETDNIKEILSKHVMSPVKFKNTLEEMLNQEVDTFIEIGPRKNLIWVCKKNK